MPFTLEPRHRHDTAEDLVVTIKDKNGPRDLSTATAVTLTMTHNTTGATKINRAACTWSSSPTVNKGQVTYVWQSTNVDTVGTWRIQWEVVFAGVKKLTWPGRADYALLQILTDIDNV